MSPESRSLLVLGHHFERLVREGIVRDYAEIARLTGMSRARVTQIVNLTLLAPEIQEKPFCPPQDEAGMEIAYEGALRHVELDTLWAEQRRRWKRS